MIENKDQLCPKCKVGRDSFLLDNKNPFCPYITCHTGDTCSKFVLLIQSDDSKDNFD